MRLNKKIFHPKNKDSNDLLSYHFKEQSKIQQKLNSKSSTISCQSQYINNNTNQDDPYLRVKANGAIVMNRSRSYTSLADHWLNDKELDFDDHDIEDDEGIAILNDLDDDHYHTDIEIKKNKYNHNRKKYIKQQKKSPFIEEENEEDEELNDIELNHFSFSTPLTSFQDRKNSTTSTHSSTSTTSTVSNHHLPQFDSFLTSSPIRIRPSFSTLPPFSSYSSYTSSSFSSSSTLPSSIDIKSLKNKQQEDESNDLLLSVPPLLPPKDIDSQLMYRSTSLPTQSPTLPSYHLTYERKLDILLEEMNSVQQENVTMMKSYQSLLNQYHLLKTELIDKDRYVQSLQSQLENNHSLD